MFISSMGGGSDLSDCDLGMVVGASRAGLSLSETADFHIQQSLVNM